MSKRSLGIALVVALQALAARHAVAQSTDTPAATPPPPPATPEKPATAAATAASPPPVAEPQAEDPGPTTEAASNDSFSLPASDSFANQGTTDGEAEQQHKLDLYGFADLTYTRLLIPESSAWNRFFTPNNSFAVGNFNLYMSSQLGDSWRALGEVRFLYLPNGAVADNTSTTSITRTDTTVLDYAGFEQPIRWGAIKIERVWVEHEFSSLFKLQAGMFLTPYGIWNVDHGTPTIIGIRAPVAIATEVFPRSQTGLQLYGNTFVEPFEIGYHLTLSNGRGPVEYYDFDDDKAFGGRLYLKTEAVGSLTIGTSFYRGGYYDRSARYVTKTIDGQTTVDQEYTTVAKYQELSIGADVKWQYKGWLAQGEFMMNEGDFENGGRPRVTVLKPPAGFQPDYRRWGGYGLIGYRTQFIQTMPYVMAQYVNSPNQPIVPPILGMQVGLNIRPTPAVVLKLEYTHCHFYGPGNAGLGLSPLRILSSQIAWAF